MRFLPEAVDHIEFDHGLQLAPEPDFGHTWSEQISFCQMVPFGFLNPEVKFCVETGKQTVLFWCSSQNLEIKNNVKKTEYSSERFFAASSVAAGEKDAIMYYLWCLLKITAESISVTKSSFPPIPFTIWLFSQMPGCVRLPCLHLFCSENPGDGGPTDGDDLMYLQSIWGHWHCQVSRSEAQHSCGDKSFIWSKLQMLPLQLCLQQQQKRKRKIHTDVNCGGERWERGEHKGREALNLSLGESRRKDFTLSMTAWHQNITFLEYL